MIHHVISFYKFARHVSRKHSLNLFEAHILFFYNALKDSEATPIVGRVSNFYDLKCMQIKL